MLVGLGISVLKHIGQKDISRHWGNSLTRAHARFFNLIYSTHELRGVKSQKKVGSLFFFRLQEI